MPPFRSPLKDSQHRPAAGFRWLALSLFFLFPPVPGAAAGLPAEGVCPSVTLQPGGDSKGVDAVPVALEEGMMLLQDDLLVIRQLVPEELWRYREAFFHEGMRMQIGSCHRRYAVSTFYGQATRKFAGQVGLDADGNLRDYRAGLPFPVDQIQADDPQAALRWAWNLELRYRGAGYRGSFRIVDMPSSTGAIETYAGDFYLLKVDHRSDLPESGYRLAGGKKKLWASGGEFKTPFSARHLAWRQFRSRKSEGRFQQPDDVFVYIPSMRKVRRAASTWVDGIFLPRYSVTSESGGGGLPFGSGLGSSGGSINPTAGQSIAISEHTPRGMTGLSLRPNAYNWRVLGERTVLAPLNVSRPGYPEAPARNFGPRGLSLASDRWDIRYAMVIEGVSRVAGSDVRAVTIYVDYQTLQPLFWITRTQRRRLLEVGVLAHRFSDDRAGYPNWPGGVPASVFDPVAASFFNALEGRGGWRRESYDLVSTPFPEAGLRRRLSSSSLVRGH